MKIGDYVRTEYGIAKIKNIFCETGYVFIETDNEIGDCSMVNKGVLRKGIIVMENDYANFRENNVKEKPIDLIEVGDYVNGLRVYEISKHTIFLDDMRDFSKKDINYVESIVTKEQFKSMKYRIGK